MKSFFYRIYHFAAIVLFAIAFIPATAYSQSCAGNNLTVNFANGVLVDNTSFEFDVYLTNTGTTTMKLAGFTGGIQYSAGTLPAGATGTFSVVTQPTANDFPTINTITASHNVSVQNLRWSNAPANAASSVTMLPNVAMKFTRVRFTSSLPWDAASTDLTFVPVSSGALVSCQALVYCNGNPVSTALTVGLGTLTLGPPLHIVLQVPLPLALTSFRGEVLEHTNMLRWETATEKNVQNHIVERSADGANWIVIGSKAGQLNSSISTKYLLEDRAPLAKAYYRLRSVDVDGKEYPSNNILLVRNNEHFGITSVYPSPTTSNVTVQFSATTEEKVTVRVMDMTGRLVMEQYTESAKDANKLLLTLNGLQSGVYSVTVSNSTTVSTPVRFVKQ